MDQIPFTERSNSISENIDVSSSTEMVQLLSQTDAEIFSGLPTEDLFSATVIESVTNLANLVFESLVNHRPEDVAVVLAGCGTSGRLGYLIAQVCNDLSFKLGLGKPFLYSIAGGDKSLLTSQEAPEDEPTAGVSSLTRICEGKKRVIYVGITCGLSAPFVGGQLEWCMKNLSVYTPILLTFNRISMARNISIPGWGKTMLDVAEEMDSLRKLGKAIVINPIVGGEPITGSSRMKGGSATKIILEAALFSALNSIEKKNSESIPSTKTVSVLKAYQNICSDFYKSKTCDVMVNLIDRAGNALKSGGAIRYVASGWTGVIPLIDSTECPPTFGSSVDDVRGFVHGGYDFLSIEDYGKENSSFKLGVHDFVNLYRNGSINNDQVFVFLRSNGDPLTNSLQEDFGSVMKSLKGKNKTVAIILVTNEEPVHGGDTLSDYFDEVLHVMYPKIDATLFHDWGKASGSRLGESLYGMCLKWLVNSVSTCGHVHLGKVFKNYMCDVKVSNNKLYHRAIGIIQKLCRVSYDAAENALLKSIHDADDVTDEIRKMPVSKHNEIATPKDKVVPLAIILAKQSCSVEQGRSILAKYPVVRNAMLEVAACH